MRIGRINYINTLPLFLGWDLSPPNFSHEFVTGTPMELNQLMGKGKLDIASISTAAYLENQEYYKIMDGFCIGAKHEALSVTLFSPVAPKLLDKKRIAITPQSKTSVVLLRVLCEEFWKITPLFIPLDEATPEDAALLIGDNAMKHSPSDKHLSYDLASLWEYETSLPFIFGLIVSRKSTSKETQLAFCNALNNSFKWGQKNRQKIYQKANESLNLPEDFIKRYFNSLHYRMTPACLESLKLFSTLAAPYLKLKELIS
ncbi:MAG: hypothetical protein GWP59_06895 [Chlamydiales bacterium]|nr:menaquinone biosynthesis protein [Chlamydiales bacterium]NCF71410.1 hypothetical protein [Chlamydiales bacterium]